ncbi:MAG TPA: histidine phosphatase family protein, partial [Brevundimonas diminuta]|nr:histidine phosphatase family protein [Brevundimonas diminuta]
MTHSESAVQTPVAAAGSAESETAYGAITLARHGEPALSRKCMITSDQYRDWWGRYEIGGLRAGQ